MTQTSTLTSMSQGSIARLLFRFSVPATLGLVANAFYNIVDRLFIGRFAGADGLGAVGLTFPLTVFVIAVGSLVGVGAASQMSRLLGRGGVGMPKRSSATPRRSRRCSPRFSRLRGCFGSTGW